jgi:hypothetical protein
VDNSSVTRKQFNIYFSGTEIIVAGKLKEPNIEEMRLRGEVRASTLNGITRYRINRLTRPPPRTIDDILHPPINVSVAEQPDWDNFLERLWAFLTIRQLLEKYDAERQDSPSTIRSNADSAKAKALELALKVNIFFKHYS